MTLGWTLILFGIVGLFLPVLQGVLFLILGLLVLSGESETARRWLGKIRERYPVADEKAREMKNRWRRWRRSDGVEGEEKSISEK